MKRLARSVAVLAVAAMIVACGRQLPPPDVVARIGGDEVVRVSEFDDYLEESAGAGASGLSNEVLSVLLDQFLNERLLRRLAIERAAATPEVGSRDAVTALLRVANAAAHPVSDGAVAAYYAAHRSEFQRPERVRLRQILTADRRTAERARAEIAGGARFALVARRLSRDPSARRGGFQGELAREDLPPAFVDAVFALAPGEVSVVLAAPYGFHIFQVTDRLPAHQLTLSEATPEIGAALERERGDRALEALVAEARRRYTLEVYAPNLPFRYRSGRVGAVGSLAPDG